jgi:tetratricopeptide (TPR) repeat protein
MKWPATTLLAALLLATSANGAMSLFDQAEAHRMHRAPADAIELYNKLLARPNLPADDGYRCRAGIIDCLRQQNKNAEALAQTQDLFNALPADHWMRPRLAPTFCDLLWTTGKKEEAAARAVEFAQMSGQDPESATSWHMRAARNFIDLRKYPDAYDQAIQASESAIAAENHGRAIDALWTASEAKYFAGDLDQVVVTLNKALALKYDDLPETLVTQLRTRIGETLVKRSRLTEARDFYATCLADAQNPALRQHWWILTAKSWQAEKNAPKAIDAYEQVFADHAWLMGRDRWYEAQNEIVSLLNQSGDTKAALSAARILFDVADTRDRASAAGMQLLQLMRQTDKTPARYKTIIAYIQNGPEGDAKNPLDAVPYADNRIRREAFEAASARLGNDAAATLHRGWMSMYLGRPNEAVTYFTQACRRVGGAQYQSAVHSLLYCGLRSARGTYAGTETFAQFLSAGPTSPADGQDLGPFTPFASKPTLPIATPATPLEVLREAAKRLETGLDDKVWPPETRLDAVYALQRIHDALDDWDRPDLLDWYTRRMLDETDAKTQAALLVSAIGPARAGQMHMAKVVQYLDRMDASALLKETDKLRKDWLKWAQKLPDPATTNQLTPHLR